MPKADLDQQGRGALTLLVALFFCGACTSMGIAKDKFDAAHPDCDDATTLRDADGSIHVLGCGEVKTYHCTTEQTYAGTRREPVYEGSGQAILGGPGLSTSPSIAAPQYRETPIYSSQTDCQEDGEAEPSSQSQAWKRAPPSKDAPPVEARTKDGRVTLRLELVLNHSGLLTLTAAPGGGAEEVSLRLARRELDRNRDRCDLTFAVNDQPVAMPEATRKREDELLAQRLRLSGPELARFDRIRRLTLFSCDRRWFLNRAQILRLREFMAQLRYEVSRATPAKVEPPTLEAPAPGPALDPTTPSASPAPPAAAP